MLPVERHAEARVEDRQRRQAGADARGAVVALGERNELVALVARPGVPVVADQPDGGVDRIRPAEGEIDVVEVARRRLGEAGGEADRRLRTRAEIAGGIGQRELRLGGGDQRLLPVAGIDAPEPGEAVEELAAGRVGDGGALPRSAPRTPAASCPRRSDGMDEVGAVELDERAKHRGPMDQPSAPGGKGEG